MQYSVSTFMYKNNIEKVLKTDFIITLSQVT